MSSTKKSSSAATNSKRTTRNASSKAAANRELILDVTEKLMLSEGYAAVSTRRVAKEAGLKAPLVHYYFKTTDDVFLALFRRAVEQELTRLEEAAASPDALRKIWDSYRNSSRTVLAVEFMALANHRKSIREEIARYTTEARQRRADVVSRLVDMSIIKPEGTSAAGLVVVLIGIARTLVMEEGLGVSLGHDDAVSLVEWWLDQLQT